MTTASQTAGVNETHAVTVLALGFGLVGIDRFLISALFPVIAKDLGLGYGDIGLVTGALAMAWGAAALLMGNLSDRIGQRRVLVGALVLFSLLIGASGLATGLVTLVLVRIAMGFADGAFTPPSIAATIQVSPPERHGRNIGIQQMTLTLFGLGLAPLLVSALLHVIAWRYIFLVFVVPGLLLAWATARTFRAAAPAPLPTARSEKRNLLTDWKAAFGYANVRVLMGLMLCWLTCLITTSALMPSYLMDHAGLEFGQMGIVMSAIGFGSAAGTLLLPWLSDRTGRKPMMLMAAAGGLAALVAFMHAAPQTTPLFACLFMVHFFNNALITMTVGPVCSETVPVGLMATASGMVIAVGEVFGGGLAPILAGKVADTFGIDHLLWLPIAALVVGFGLCLLLRETLPAAVRRRAATA